MKGTACGEECLEDPEGIHDQFSAAVFEAALFKLDRKNSVVGTDDPQEGGVSQVRGTPVGNLLSSEHGT